MLLLLLENYSLRFGINGAKWRVPFSRGEEEERAEPEQARQKLIPLLEKLQDTYCKVKERNCDMIIGDRVSNFIKMS